MNSQSVSSEICGSSQFHRLLRQLEKEHDREIAFLKSHGGGNSYGLASQSANCYTRSAPFGPGASTPEGSAMVASPQHRRASTVSSELGVGGFQLLDAWAASSGMKSLSTKMTRRLSTRTVWQNATHPVYEPPSACVMSPSSGVRTCWDTFGLFILVYDLFWIPMQVFDVPVTTVTLVLDWMALLYWTTDIPASFLVGYFTRDGKVVMDRKQIAARYLRSWFVVDVTIVGIDWTLSVMEFLRPADGVDSAGGMFRVGKMSRAARILRSIRLMRAMKLKHFMYLIHERISSEWTSILVGMALNVSILVSVNHIIACLWFWFGTSLGFCPQCWVYSYEYEDAGYIVQYLISLHWSLTQFTPASMTVQPQNPYERAFAVLMVLFAMIAFSSFLSNITAAMTRLRNLKDNELGQFFVLRKFLSQNNVSRNLSLRVTRYIDVALEIHKRKVDRSQVELLNLLTGPLNVELTKELYEQYLIVHPFFASFSEEAPSAMRQLCFLALAKSPVSRGDVLFPCGYECREMFFLAQGSLFYQRPSKVKTKTRIPVPRVVCISRDQWFCEGALWVPWTHSGTMTALIESDIITIDSAKFREVSVAHQDVLHIVRERAYAFVNETNQTMDTHGHVWDLPPYLMYSGGLSRSMPVSSKKVLTVMDEVRNAEALEAFLRELSDSSDEEVDLGEDDDSSGARSPQDGGAPSDCTDNLRRLPTDSMELSPMTPNGGEEEVLST